MSNPGIASKANKVFSKALYAYLVVLLLVFCTMVGMNEYTLIHGHKLMLKTVPVDPRDLLRGDYVILDYEISNFFMP